MRDRLEEFGAHCDVTFVIFGSADDLRNYSRDHPLPFPVLRDANRSAYRAFGFGRGSWLRVWGRKAAKRYVELIRSDGIRGLRMPRQDTRQLGGDMLIGSDGTLRYGFWGEGPDDRPSIDTLVEAVRSF